MIELFLVVFAQHTIFLFKTQYGKQYAFRNRMFIIYRNSRVERLKMLKWSYVLKAFGNLFLNIILGKLFGVTGDSV